MEKCKIINTSLLVSLINVLEVGKINAIRAASDGALSVEECLTEVAHFDAMIAELESD